MTLNYQTSLYSTTQPLSPLADEQLVIACLSDARPRAMLWSAKQSLVVPRSYKRFANFAQAAESMRLKGWPVYIRQSGGGVVPQLSGILNLSLCWADYGRPLDLSAACYEHLCALIQSTLARQQIRASAEAVEGSFCDGRYNLAVKNDNGIFIKIVGTAQHWSNARSAAWYTNTTRKAGDPTDWHIVLAHALLFIDCNLTLGTAQANKLEELLGNSRHYEASKVISFTELGVDTAQFEQDLLAILMASSPPAHHHFFTNTYR